MYLTTGISVRTFALVLLTAVASGAPLRSTSQPATAASQPATVRVTGVTGEPYALNTNEESARWVRLKVGDELGAGWILRTGFRSTIDVESPGRWRVHVGPATKIGVSNLGDRAASRETNFFVKYGTVRWESSDGRFTITTPVTPYYATSCPSQPWMLLEGPRGTWLVVPAEVTSRPASTEEAIRKLLRDLRRVTSDNGLTVEERKLLETYGSGSGSQPPQAD